MPLDRNGFLDAASCKMEEVTIKGLGTVLVGSVSQEVHARVVKLTRSEDPEVQLSAGTYLVQHGVRTVDGARMFSDSAEDAARIAKLDSEVLQELALAIRAVSKITVEAVASEGEASAPTS